METEPGIRFLRVCGVASLVFSFLFLGGGPAAAVSINPWSPAASMSTPRGFFTATLLGNGEVLVAGGEDASSTETASAELYDPTTNTWSPAASLAQSRAYQTATLLGNGKVLVAGGLNNRVSLTSAELYDPATNTWSSAGSMTTGRFDHTATLLPSGNVLVAGGRNFSIGRLSSAELYDPATNSWSKAATMPFGRYAHTATLLGTGKVLVAGGVGANNSRQLAELYDPATNSWSLGAAMSSPRISPTATLLGSGKVLVAGGEDFATPNVFLASAELYDPTTDTWSPAATMAHPHAEHTATLLGDGTVLVAGGAGGGATAELYHPAADMWLSAGSMAAGRRDHTATLLANGKVLVAGGVSGGCCSLASAELYDPYSVVEDSDPRVQFDGWVGFTDPAADGGAYRASKLSKDTVKFVFSGTAVTWLSRSGPDRGMAAVTIDGSSAGTFDLYAPSAGAYSQAFSGLTNAAHAIVVKVLGTKNASSTNTWVPVDGFTVGSTTTQESSPAVKLGTWSGQIDANASGGTYRVSSTPGASSTLTFTGTSIDWVTATGKSYGQAEVTIDGVSQGTVDLYASTAQWQVPESYNGLSPGPHTIVVKVLGTKNPSSKGTAVVVDAFIVHP